MTKPRPSGHRGVPHTADARIEAWAGSREQCVAEAVAALVDGFADISAAPVAGTVEFRAGPAPDPDLLVAVLDRVIYLIDTEGQLPTGTDIRLADGILYARLRMAGPDRIETFGAVPKAVSLNDLRFECGEEGWSCAVTLDV